MAIAEFIFLEGAITFAHIFQKFRLRTVFICAQKCISFAHNFSVTFARVSLVPWPAYFIISALLTLFTDLELDEFEMFHFEKQKLKL